MKTKSCKMLKIITLVCCLSVTSASNMILGTRSGKIYICQENHLDDCLILLDVRSSTSINALAVSGDWLYAGISSSTVLRCERLVELKCRTFIEANSPVQSLAVSGEDLYVGLSSGIIMRCSKYEANKCIVFHTHDAPITGIAIYDSTIYVATYSQQILRCYMVPNSCVKFQQAGTAVNALSVSNSYLFAGLHGGGILWRCDLHRQDSCTHFNVADVPINSVAVAFGYIYAGLGSKVVWRCSLNTQDSCQALTVRYDDSEVLSIAVITTGSLWSFSNTQYLSQSGETNESNSTSLSPLLEFIATTGSNSSNFSSTEPLQ